MKYIYTAVVLLACVFLCSCSSTRSSAYGVASRNINTTVNSHNEYDLDIQDYFVTYTIDVSTDEGRLKLNGLSKSEAAEVAERQAAIKNQCDCIFDPKYDFLTKGKHVLRVTVVGRPANYKNTTKKHSDTNYIMLK